MHPARRLAVVVALAIGVVAGAGLVAGCSGGTDAVDQTAGGDFRFVSAQQHGKLLPVGKRKTAPDISGPDLTGSGKVDLAKYRGKVILLNFWAQWCPPCRAEAPDLEQLYRTDVGKGFQVVGVNAKDDAQLARSFLRNHDLTYPSIDDPQSKVALRFRGFAVANLPWSILLDKHGKVAAVYSGGVLSSDLTPAVDKLLAER